MNELKFHHLGYATENLDETIGAFESLGFTLINTAKDENQNIRIAVLRKPDHPLVELITPDNPHNPVNRFLKNNYAIPYHMAYTAKNFDKTLKTLREKGFVVATKLLPSRAFNNRKIVFLYKKQTGLIELMEEIDIPDD
ncbi:MAG: VOC family protein [Candidatus Altiarchaeota archaeon]